MDEPKHPKVILNHPKEAKKYSDDDLEAMTVVYLEDSASRHPLCLEMSLHASKRNAVVCLSLQQRHISGPDYIAAHSVVQGQDVAKTQTTAQHQTINQRHRL